MELLNQPVTQKISISGRSTVVINPGINAACWFTANFDGFYSLVFTLTSTIGGMGNATDPWIFDSITGNRFGGMSNNQNQYSNGAKIAVSVYLTKNQTIYYQWNGVTIGTYNITGMAIPG